MIVRPEAWFTHPYLEWIPEGSGVPSDESIRVPEYDKEVEI